MKRWISLLLALALLLAACLALPAGLAGGADGQEQAAEHEAAEAGDAPEADEGGEDADAEGGDEEDDSIQIPVPDSQEDWSESSLETRLLQAGDEGDDVLFLQMRLAALGYFTGNADGKYGEGTQNAVRKFQEDYLYKGLEATGLADIGTQLMAATAQYRTLKRNDSGDDVADLQARLAELGFYKGKISGDYLDGTKNGVSQFQKYNGMEQTGIADPMTQETIYSTNAVGRYDDEEAPTPAPNFDASFYLVDESENSAPMPPEPVYYSRTLTTGVSAPDLVKQLQERLKQLGYYTGKISGKYTSATVTSVKKLQKQNGLVSDGITGEQTWNVIFNDPGVVLPGQPAKPAPKPQYSITVDTKSQVVTVYTLDEYNEYTIPVRFMLCSSGKVGTATPVGDWELNGRKARWCYFPKWGDYARYWTRINAQVAFHSPIYSSPSTDALKEKSYKLLGSKASHGCVRLMLEDAKWIYENIPAGTIVHVPREKDIVYNEETKDALKHDKPRTPNGSKPAATPEPAYSRENKPVLNGKLAKGSKGSAVYWVQRRLQELALYDAKCTGEMKSRTIQAVKDFQKAYGFMQTGTVTQELIDAMAAAERITPAPAATPAPPEN